MPEVITDNLDLWTSALLTKSTAGRGSNGKLEAYGIKKLRELILELAVRGKLVPQDPNDEPASTLLEKIAHEKARLNNEGGVRKREKQSAISDSEKPFHISASWDWARLGDVVEVVRGITFPASEKSRVAEEGRVACLRTTNVQDRIEWDDILYVRREFVARDEQFVRVSDIVMSTANSRELVGKVAIIKEEPESQTAFGGFLTVLRPILLDPSFVMVLLRTPISRNALIDSASQTTNIANISIGKLNPLVMAIPPLAEQHRIVAKVDELMALCDQLEQQQTDSLAAHQTMVETLLGTLTHVESQQEFSAAWARIASHFDTLFTTEASIDELKQTILQLAVMGKLVPQDQNDEPASLLLQRIQVEKARLIAEGKIKKDKLLPPITDDGKPFELPQGWKWVRFPELGEFGRGKSKHRPRNEPKLFDPGIYPLVQTGEVARANNVIDEYHSKYSEVGLAQSKMWPAGTLCITIAANIADSAILGFDACFPDSVVGFKPCEPLSDTRYFLAFMKTARENLLKFAPSTAQKNINLEILESVLIPLPPLKEILRIVAKVDELMALCDSLKVRLADAQAIQIYLADAIVEQAVA